MPGGKQEMSDVSGLARTPSKRRLFRNFTVLHQRGFSGTSPYYTREGWFRNFTVLHRRGDFSGTSPYYIREIFPELHRTTPRFFRNFTVLHRRRDVSGTSPYYIREGKRRASAQTYPKVERVERSRCSPLLAPNMRHQRLFEGPIALARPDPQTSP